VLINNPVPEALEGLNLFLPLIKFIVLSFHLKEVLIMKKIFVLVFMVLFLSGCKYRGTQKISNYCLKNSCPPCKTDADCRFSSNRCYKTTSCIHKKVPLAHTLLGCNKEYKEPEKENCRCIANECQSPEEE
jgi:hypothetical protein